MPQHLGDHAWRFAKREQEGRARVAEIVEPHQRQITRGEQAMEIAQAVSRMQRPTALRREHQAMIDPEGPGLETLAFARAAAGVSFKR